MIFVNFNVVPSISYELFQIDHLLIAAIQTLFPQNVNYLPLCLDCQNHLSNFAKISFFSLEATPQLYLIKNSSHRQQLVFYYCVKTKALKLCSSTLSFSK